MDKERFPIEESLDPQDWGAFRELAHRMLEDMLDYQQQVRQRPVWQPVPPEVKAFLKQPLPLDPTAARTGLPGFCAVRAALSDG